jgi:hypothetical protein
MHNVIESIKNDDSISIYPTILSCAENLNTSRYYISNLLENGKPFVDKNIIILRRVKIY